MWRGSSSTRARGEGAGPPLAGGAGKVLEPARELVARPALTARDLPRELAHREQGRGGNVVLRHHLCAEHPDLVLLYLAVLVFTETVLQALEVPHRLLMNRRIMQRGEELQQVTQLLAAFAQVMQAFRGRVGGDRRPPPQHLPVCPANAVGGQLCGRHAPPGRWGRQ